MDERAVLRNPYLASLPTLIIPGLSHFLLGKRRRALAFFFIVTCCFLLGVLMDGGIFPVTSGNWLYRLAGLGEMGGGLLYFVSLALGVNGITPEVVSSVMFGYGSTFVITAGLMNMLLMMDAFDIAIGRKVYE